MLNFCTLFDKNFLTRGLALYRSLIAANGNSHLFIFAFGDEVYQCLLDLRLEKATVISLREFEDQELLHIKPTRSPAEYCWTCTPSTILYVLKRFDVESCTYLDADLYFYSDPEVLINEMGSKSVLITSHRYTPEYDQSATSGKYCVQFMTFKNDKQGLEVLTWWRNACIDWCYARFEDGKFGDQKYLDDWPVRFKAVHELSNLGGGVAPWNLQQYAFKQKDGALIGEEIASGRTFEVVFFHFHGVRFYKESIVKYGNYSTSPQALDLVYTPYINALMKEKEELLNCGITFDPNGANAKSPYPVKGLRLGLKLYFEGLKTGAKYLFGFGFREKWRNHHYYKIK